MNEISTIKVYYKPGKYEMIINESDFDDEIHKKVEPEKPAEVEPEKPAKQTRKKSIDDDELKALIGEK